MGLLLKLTATRQAVNKEDTSHLVTVPAGTRILADALLSSPILEGAPGAMAACVRVVVVVVVVVSSGPSAFTLSPRAA